MSKSPPEPIGKMDWWINNLTWVAAPFTIPATSKVISAGVAVTRAASVKFDRIGWYEHKRTQIGLVIHCAR